MTKKKTTTKKKPEEKPKSAGVKKVGRGSPPVETRFKPGQSGNPGGRSKDPPEYRLMQNLTKTELAGIGNLICKKSPLEIKDMVNDALSGETETSSIHCMVAAVVGNVIRKGDMVQFNALLDRLIGKVKEEVKHEGKFEVSTKSTVIVLPHNGRDIPETKK